ncbi:hypothetical protein [Bacillus wiedmannii]|uniref:hypothetical protein n=1 Tax=Bacillus wiedmannii TaxID=1890302 RepID=UPI0007DB3A3C|nr:hypothetical protein [Bacillus wiedmannii]OAK16217.1 hypothetical protein A6282_17660 [Bacillus wiedmannii]
MVYFGFHIKELLLIGVLILSLLGWLLLGIYFAFWKPIQSEKDLWVKIALGANVFLFGILYATPFIFTTTEKFNGYFWLIFSSFIIIELVLLLINCKVLKDWQGFIELSLKIFELYAIVFVALFFSNSAKIGELIKSLPNSLSGIPDEIAIMLYGIYGILKICDGCLSFKKYLK